MELEPYVDEVRRLFAATARAGDEEGFALADRLIAPLEAALRLELQHALADAAVEITVELAPGSVELRLRGRELVFVVTPPPVETGVDDLIVGAAESGLASAPAGDEGEMARINVRMPEQLKARVEQAASAQRMSVNAWLVRAADAALDRADVRPDEQRTARSAHRYRGWAR